MFDQDLKRMRLVKEPYKTFFNTYSRGFENKVNNIKYAFDCDVNGWVDREKLNSGQRKNFDQLLVNVALNKAIDLGVNVREMYKEHPAMGACIKCNNLVPIEYVSQCDKCGAAYKDGGIYCEELTRYFEASRRMKEKDTKKQKGRKKQNKEEK